MADANDKIQSPVKEKQKYITRLGALDTEFATWWPHYQELSAFYLPRAGRFFVQDRNRGERRNQSIYDSTGTRALRILAAGIMSGATSPARPWFRYATSDAAMMKSQNVRVWCNQATQKGLDILQRSNAYRALHNSYEELGIFGTHLLVKQNDFNSVINLYPSTAGEYRLMKNSKGDIEGFYRKWQMQVNAMVDPVNGFGYENCSNEVQQLYDRGTIDAWITVVQVCEPRYDRDPTKKDAKNMAWKSLYFELSDGDPKFLRESGFKSFPGLAPRWGIFGGDVYGSTSPGMEALGDVKQLQHEQLRKAQGIDYMTKPPLQLPNSMKGREHETLPGGTAYYDQATPNGGIRAQFQVQLDLNHLLQDIQDVRQRIQDAFYTDLFRMFPADSANETRMTATEVAERHEEKLVQLGPVIERLHNELFAPLVEYVFERMIETGILPPPPPELQGQELNIEFISMLAQAQKAVTTNSVDRFVVSMGTLVQMGKQDVLDKFDSDKWADIYSDALGVDPELIIPDSKVALVRKQRAQVQQQQMQAEQAQAASQTAKNLGQVNTAQKNGATDIMNNFSGYTTPGVVQ